ncbi:hypothetical protein JTB14_012255 [Gonioctena quinquepunctata]|nr:hypothetical protein JTB14_012255 [Gonioctena quinquepunctata]
MKIGIQNEYGTMMDSKKILKKLNNLRTNIKKKTDRKATGNKKNKLSAAESVIYNIMQGGSDENPVFSNIPGNDEVDRLVFLEQLQVIRMKKEILLRKKMEEEKTSDGSGIQRIGDRDYFAL